MRVQRTLLMAQLETVRHGLSPKDIVDQASCFAFTGGRVMTFNDECACWCPCEFSPESGGVVVPSAQLLSLLPKLPDEVLDITVSDEGLVIKGKNKTAHLRIESEIRLPIDTVTIAKEDDYFEVPEGFVEGLSLVEGCVGTDDSKFALTCVHLTAKFVEACDDDQLARYRIKLTGLKDEKFLIRKDAVKAVLSIDVKKMAMSGNWLFLKDDRGVVVACRRYKEAYPNVTAVIEKAVGVPSVLPKGLGEAAANAAIFSADNTDDDHILVKLRDGVASITGEGAGGKYNERKRVEYTGDPIAFRISPKLLAKITKEYPECEVGPETMKVVVGRLTYVVSLSVPDRKPEVTEE